MRLAVGIIARHGTGKKMISIIDYGSGNLRSVSKALDHLGVANRVTANPSDIEKSDRVLLPGVGAFGACVDGVRASGFEDPIRAFIETGRPFLGICVGMQILMERSEESPDAKGLGIFEGSVDRFQPGLKIPHMGWNEVETNGSQPALLKGIAPSSYFYFVHSFFVRPTGKDAQTVVGKTEYGETFASVIERENVFATQFHPEKSQACGLKLLENFSKI